MILVRCPLNSQTTILNHLQHIVNLGHIYDRHKNILNPENSRDAEFFRKLGCNDLALGLEIEPILRVENAHRPR